jgi:hypothetical protein
MSEEGRSLKSRLQQADCVSSIGYGRGFSVLLPWGQEIVDRLIQLFRDCFGGIVLGEWREWQPELLVDEAQYDNEVGAVGGFGNVFRLELGGRRLVLRPDAAVDGLRQARAAGQGSRVGSAFCAYTAHRDLRGSCTPLWRDRAIWPVMQLDVVASDGASGVVHGAIVSGLNRYFTLLGLPTRTVDMGSWKEYARRRLDWVLATDRSAPTVLAMAYTVGDHYRSIVGISDDSEAFDVGLTAKPLATIVQLVNDGERLVLPRAIAPVEAVVAGPDPDVLPQFSPEVRVAYVDSAAKNWPLQWERRGVPVLLQFDRAGWAQQRIGNRPWDSWDPASSLDAQVDVACGPDLPIASARPRGDEARFEALCDSCALGYVLHAPVTPQRDEPCQRCGGDGRLRLMAGIEQIY